MTKTILAASFLFFSFSSHAEEIKCDEQIAQGALKKATQNLEASIKNGYPHLSFDCEPNKGYAPVNFDIVDLKMEEKKGAQFDFFKGSAVCTMVDEKVRQKTKTGYSITIDKKSCTVISVSQAQSKTNFY